MRDLIVVGGGAAGLAAAAYAFDKQLDVLVVSERLSGKAGWLRHASEAQPAPRSSGELVVATLRERVTQIPEHALHDEATEITKTDGVFRVETKRNGCLEAVAVLIATGVTPVALDVPGGKELLGYGLGYSAATHAQELRGTVAAAIGSTPRALRGVHELSRLASMVYWIGPTMKELMSPLGMSVQYRHNVKVFEGYHVVEVIGADRVEAIIIKREGDVRRLDVDGAFVDLGLKPNSAIVENLVACNSEGFIRITDNGTTSLPGLFAAGDVTTALGEQLLVAVGQGAFAAVSAYDYVLSHVHSLHV